MIPRPPLDYLDVQRLIADDNAILDPDEVAVWLKTTRRNLLDNISKHPKFPKPIGTQRGRGITPRWAAAHLREWARL